MHRTVPLLALTCLAALSGCGGGTPQPASIAPPVPAAAAPVGSSNGGNPGAVTAAANSAPMGNVFQWQDVPRAQQVPITRAMFDQNGYQLLASTGETIAVPFQNQNLYVMQFGRSVNGDMYFINQGSVPILYVPRGGFLENAMAQGARWYPIPDDFAYERPMYVAVAPSWGDYVNMGWYPGMSMYGGRWGYHPGFGLAWMPMFVIHIGGGSYRSYNVYHTYYTSHPGYVRTRHTLNYTLTGRPGTFRGSSRISAGSFGGGSRRSFGGGGSFGSGSASRTSRQPAGDVAASSGSFGKRRSFGGGSGSFGGSRRTEGGGSFGSRRPSGGSSFGSSRPSGGGSFGGRTSGGSSFGSSRPSGGGSFGSSRPSGGSSFGSSRPSGGSFGGSRRR